MAQTTRAALATPADTWQIILNEHAGPQGTSQTLCDQLTARLRSASLSLRFHIHETKYPNHAAEIGQTLVQSGSDKTLAIIGGDGTLHELINGIMTGDEITGTSSRINVVLLPSGTANALYHSLFPSTCSTPDFDKFLSVEHALSRTISACRPLALLSVAESSSSAQKYLYYSHVVTSTCLHAQLLETASSADWRKLYPGTERFRKAAEKHIGTSYNAHLRLAARDTQGVQKWSPKDASWQTVSKGNLELKGGFTYFVASLVDRFEATFRITPLSAPEGDRPVDAVDVLLVRSRSDDREVEAKRLMQVLMAAYSEDGKHLGIQEEVDGKPTYVVEYYRVKGFHWQPLDDAARSICVDGTTFRLEPGRALSCSVVPPSASTTSFFMHA